MSSEKERLCAMPRESRRFAGKSEQDIDQRAQVTEGVVLSERVFSELVICLIGGFCLPEHWCTGLAETAC